MLKASAERLQSFGHMRFYGEPGYAKLLCNRLMSQTINFRQMEYLFFAAEEVG